MTSKDIVFLNDFINFGYLQHYVVALAIYQAGVDAEQLAIKAHQDLEFKSPDEAIETARELLTGGRVRSVAIARLYAERASAYEDLGALLHAIRNRHPGGLFKSYLNSSAAQVERFYRSVVSAKPADLGAMLNLPTIGHIQQYLSEEEVAILAQEYSQFASDIANIAGEYQGRISSVSAYPDGHELEGDWRDQIYLALKMVPRQAGTGNLNNSLMVEAYNKIKHRFTVIERIQDFLQADPYDEALIAAIQPRRPEWAEKLLVSVAGVTTRAMEIASIMLKLAEAGIDL